MADFTGFYFDNIHSSTYGILRVSDGDRYEEGLIPEFEDKTLEPVGIDGSLYESRRFIKTEFTIKIAYDNMTESQLHNLRRWLSTSELKGLRFDEKPYKEYWAKPSARPVLNYICFLVENERRYKGEGEIRFVAYNPFGYCNNYTYELTPTGSTQVGTGINWQVSDTYVPFTIIDDNITEWGDDAGLKSNLAYADYNVFTKTSTTASPAMYDDTAEYYNPGDVESDFSLFIQLDSTVTSLSTITQYDSLDINIYIGEDETDTSNFTYAFEFDVDKLNSDDTIILDTKKHALVVYTHGAENGKSLRYDLIHSTDWPKIPTGEGYIKVSSSLPHLNESIKYSYIYY